MDRAHGDGVWAVAWAADNTLVTGSVDETVKFWCDACAGAGAAPLQAAWPARSG